MATSDAATTNKVEAGAPSRLGLGPRRHLALAAVLASCTVIYLYLDYRLDSKMRRLAVLRHTASNVSTSPRDSTSVPSVNWTRCPSENVLRAEQYFNHWDENLAQKLRLSPQTTPKMEQERWHAVSVDVQVFSAFLVTTERRAIHIISLVRERLADKDASNKHPPLECLVRSSNLTTKYDARIKMVWTWNKYNPAFQNAFILCPQPDKTSLAAHDNIQVAVTFQSTRNSSLRWLQLHIPSDKSKEKCCAVCVRPFYGSSISLWQIVEFIAHYRLLGAPRFYFYDLEMSPDVKLLLGRLQAVGIDITVVTFKLLNASRIMVPHEGQMQGLYDCIFRSMSKDEYYITVDFDELITLQFNGNFSTLLQREESKLGKQHFGSVIISSRLHCSEYPMTTRHAINGNLPLRATTFPYYCEEDAQVQMYGYTKYVARSRSVCIAGVHSVEKHCGDAQNVWLATTVAVINHYRRCCYLPKLPCTSSRVCFHEPSKKYLADIESDLAIMTMKNVLSKV
ncbi:uncharacterized protein LOC144104643 [Amblyomma americanum]